MHSLGIAHATKAKVIGSRVELSFAASAGDITGAVLVGTKKRASTLHALFAARFARIETVRRTFGINRDFAISCQGLVIIGSIPMGSPFLHIACHIEQTIPVGRERANRSGREISVLASVGVREVTLKGIRHVVATGHELVPH